jgi:hypothetical protein
MRFIAHRGNLVGPKIDLENDPNYIEKALTLGFDVEIDLWFVESDLEFFLGHDYPQYLITFRWLEKYSEHLWIHCKNNKAILEVSKNKNLHYFWHQNDDYTITSKGYIWAYPGQEVNSKSVLVLPERTYDISKFDLSKLGAFGICSDYVEDLNNYI